MKQVFESKITIPFHMADPAGIIFYGHVFSLAHAEYEKWLSEAVGGWDKWFSNPQWVAPIKKTEAEYFAPIRAGQNINFKLYVKDSTESSFTTYYEFYFQDQLCAKVETVQVFCDRKSLKKIPIPEMAKKIIC